MGKYTAAKKIVYDYFQAMEQATPEQVPAVMAAYLSADYGWRASYPFRDLDGMAQVGAQFWAPLKTSLQHMQRRMDIFIGGNNEFDDEIWVMSMGHFMGLFDRYIEQHTGPFRRGLGDKAFNGHVVRFAEGDFACFFGWPNLSNRNIGGFLGMCSGDVRADMVVVDVYCRRGDKLAENWVFFDLIWWCKQQGLDVLGRTEGILNK